MNFTSLSNYLVERGTETSTLIAVRGYIHHTGTHIGNSSQAAPIEKLATYILLHDTCNDQKTYKTPSLPVELAEKC